MVFVGRARQCGGEGRCIHPCSAVALDVLVSTYKQARVGGRRLACSVAQSTTMPSSNDELAVDTLLNMSMYARVMCDGGSEDSWMPYLVAVISKKDISRRMLFSAEMSRSRVRYIGWNCEFATSGSRILLIMAPRNWI